MRIMVINGPNLNLLGTREPDIYGADTLETLKSNLEQYGREQGVEFSFIQSPFEGEIINAIHDARQLDGLIINPAGYSHYSIAILDALKAVETTKVEVHISQVHQRESFRQHFVTAAGCDATITGMGLKGYELAAEFIRHANAR